MIIFLKFRLISLVTPDDANPSELFRPTINLPTIVILGKNNNRIRESST